MGTKFPLAIQIEYFTRSKDANTVAEWLQLKFNDDPNVPGIRMPIFFTPDDGGCNPPTPKIVSEAERVMVVLLADDYLTVNARTPTDSGMTWADYFVKLKNLCDESEHNEFIPIQLTQNGWPIDTRLDDLNVVRAWAVDKSERCNLIARRITNQLIKQLSASKEKDTHPVTIFLSHTKLDLEQEPYVVKSLISYLTVDNPEKVWFDSGDIPVGSRFKEQIERGVANAALLAVMTDSYSSRSWCRREVLLAKQYHRPVVVVDAVQDREIRSFPYAGNTPVIRWKDHPQDVIDLLLLETLRHVYAEKCLVLHKQDKDTVFSSSPELVTLFGQTSKSILYPDPPLGSEELGILNAAGLNVETPLERHAKQNDLHKHSLIIALSVSEAEDLPKYGLRLFHLDSILLELSRYLLLAGIRLAYGGDLSPKNSSTLK